MKILNQVIVIFATLSPAAYGVSNNLEGRYILDVENSDYFTQLELSVKMLRTDEDEEDRADAETMVYMIEAEKSSTRYINVNSNNSFFINGGYCKIKEIGTVKGVHCFRDKNESIKKGGVQDSERKNMTIRTTSSGITFTDSRDRYSRVYVLESQKITVKDNLRLTDHVCAYSLKTLCNGGVVNKDQRFRE